MSREEFNRLALRQKQSLPLEGKIILTQQRIREWYDHWDGQVYVSFSGGKDSTVLLHLVRDMYPDVPAVFVDTGLEFPEIRNFATSRPNVTVVRPDMRFDKVIDEYGYPVGSKAISRKISSARRGVEWVIPYVNGTARDPHSDKRSRYCLSEKWRSLLDAPFNVSDKCCDIMKKAPLKAYQKQTGRKPFIGTMADESVLRRTAYLKTGCNAFDGANPSSKPLSIWCEDDVWEYIHTRNLEYASVYDLGYDRTGCMFCMFGCHLEKAPNRFQRMKEIHPRQYDYCMRSREEKGLGLREVLEYIGVEYE